MTVQAGGEPADRRDPLAVRVIRGIIAALVWAALAFPVSGMFRWVGEVLAMPPSYGPSWKLFVVAVGVVLFLAFVLEPYRGDEEADGMQASDGDDSGRADGPDGRPPWSSGDV